MSKHDISPAEAPETAGPDFDALGITPDAETARGRPGPSKFTADRLTRIYHALTQGATHEHAAFNAGISDTTLAAWMVGKPGFSALVKKAEEVYIDEHLKGIAAHGVKQWVARAWLLERRWHNRFGQMQRVALDVKHSGSVAALAEKRPGDLAQQLAHLVKSVAARVVPALPAGQDDTDIHDPQVDDVD